MKYVSQHIFMEHYAQLVDKHDCVTDMIQCMNEFPAVLQEILNSELAMGNLVSSASRGWPYDDSIFIMLQAKFYQEYDLSTYQELVGPHYHWAEYSCAATSHILASPLKN